MAWFGRKSDKTEADQSLTAMQSAASIYGGDEDESELFLTLRETPATRTPGTRLAVLNEGTVVEAGQDALLQTTFAEHPTRIVAIFRDGQPVDRLDEDEEGEVVLSAETDLSAVYRTSCLASLDEAGTNRYSFLLQVHTAEQRGKDAYLVGPATGSVGHGDKVVVSPWDDSDERISKVRAVETLADGTTGILLAKRDASTLQFGDEVCAIEGVRL